LPVSRVVFARPGDALPAPPDWPKNVVQGKSYDLAEPGGSVIEQMLEALLARHGWLENADPRFVPGPVFGEDRLARVRVGQRAFQALVLDSYGRRCAVTGDKIVPVLEAAHVRGVSQGGENRVDNGLLLRSDVHTLFDRGYLSVHPDRRSLMVSPRLRSDFGNGEEFYAARHPVPPSSCLSAGQTGRRGISSSGTLTPCSRSAEHASPAEGREHDPVDLRVPVWQEPSGAERNVRHRLGTSLQAR
jgi:HNH endonuclease